MLLSNHTWKVITLFMRQNTAANCGNSYIIIFYSIEIKCLCVYICKHIEKRFYHCIWTQPTLQWLQWKVGIRWPLHNELDIQFSSNWSAKLLHGIFNWTVGKKQLSFPLPLEGTWSIGGLGGITGKLQWSLSITENVNTSATPSGTISSTRQHTSSGNSDHLNLRGNFYTV